MIWYLQALSFVEEMRNFLFFPSSLFLPSCLPPAGTFWLGCQPEAGRSLLTASFSWSSDTACFKHTSTHSWARKTDAKKFKIDLCKLQWGKKEILFEVFLAFYKNSTPGKVLSLNFIGQVFAWTKAERKGCVFLKQRGGSSLLSLLCDCFHGSQQGSQNATWKTTLKASLKCILKYCEGFFPISISPVFFLS